MIQLVNFASGEVEIAADSGQKLRLTRDQANRMILMARMHTVAEFVEKLPTLITDAGLLRQIQATFAGAPSSTDQWNLKEKFARLVTLTKDYQPKDPSEIIESVKFL